MHGPVVTDMTTVMSRFEHGHDKSHVIHILVDDLFQVLGVFRSFQKALEASV